MARPAGRNVPARPGPPAGTRPWTARAGALAVLVLAALAPLSLTACKPAPPPAASPEFARAMNLGKAHLENKNADGALEEFGRAVQLELESAAALRNLARAQLLARKHEEALATLARAEKLEPGSPAAAYLAGIAHAREGRFAEAIPYFETAVRLDPADAPARFQLANAYQAVGEKAKAVAQLEETVRLDPMHASAHFKLATEARLAGDRDTFEREQREFMRLRELTGDEARSAEALEASVYTKAEPAAARPEPIAAAPEATPAAGAPAVTFADATDRLPAEVRGATAAAVLEVDPRGRPTLVVAGPGGRLWLVTPSAGAAGGFEAKEIALPAAAGGGAGGPVEAIAVGDFHDTVPAGVDYDPAVHARNDVLLLGPGSVRLLERTLDGGFTDVTAPAGLAGLAGPGGEGPLASTHPAVWVDADHDGDLDLAIGGGPGGVPGLRLYRNRGDGTFAEAAEEMGIAVAGPVVDVAAADLDGDVGVDLTAARGEAGTALLVNQHAGRFAPQPEPPGPWPPARRVLVGDVDNDGRPEAVLLGAGAAEVVALGRAGGGQIDLGGAGGDGGIEPAAAALFDYDNDGRLDLAVAPAHGALRLWRNASSGAFTEASADAGLAVLSPPPGPAGRAGLLAADLDGDGDTDLLLAGPGGLRLLDNRLSHLDQGGGDAHRQLKVRLAGTKTNPTGLGTHVEVRAGTFLASREASGPVVEIGVGDHGRLDSVQTVWTNGVVDNQIDVDPAGGPLTVVEKIVATGSCPFLYAWDGERFSFVTDLLGNSPLGLALTREEVLPADPDEYVWIGGPERGTRLAPRDGAFELEVTSEFREVVYLDQVRLVAVDHSPKVEVESTDRLGPPPFPPSELWALGRPRPPRIAFGEAAEDAGGAGSGRTDLTAVLAARDGRFADAGRRLPPPYRGMTEPYAVTLDLGDLAAVARPVLALTGWLQYGDGSTNIAASQNPSLTVIPPRLEAETAPGRWRPLDVFVGLPAGKTKTILVDLAGRLPAGARRLRLTTTFEVRWDAIALAERLGTGDAVPAGASTAAGAGISTGAQGSSVLAIHELSPAGARLAHRGFSDLRARAPLHPTTPDHAVVAARPPWRTTPAGWSTRYGETVDLVAARDGRLVVLNSGDALRLTFPAAAFPPVPAGRVRTFFFYSVGWDKDSDPNNLDATTVDPLPQEADLTTDWWRTTLTRWVPADLYYPRR